jgi:ParB family transcriptional regulator, chromosome partitioning protein
MTQPMKRGLGRGIDALLPPLLPETSANDGAGYRFVSIDSIVPNRQQPRTIFDEEKLRELADSIREQGILQPLAVSKLSDGRYELIAGERRLRASRIAGLAEVPVVIKDVNSERMLALSIIENIQREDLNPIEEANAYVELMNQFGYTQDDVAKKVGRSRVSVANGVRLLKLPRAIQDDVAAGRYTAGHARAILSIEGIHEQLKAREMIIREMPTVRDVEKMVQAFGSSGKKSARRKPALTPQMNELCERMKQSLGTKVSLAPSGIGGKITIEYYSPQELDKIFNRLIGA